jgi:hypothetical protein
LIECPKGNVAACTIPRVYQETHPILSNSRAPSKRAKGRLISASFKTVMKVAGQNKDLDV